MRKFISFIAFNLLEQNNKPINYEINITFKNYSSVDTEPAY